MARFAPRNGRILATVRVSGMPSLSRTFDHRDAAAAWASKTEAAMRSMVRPQRDGYLSESDVMMLPRTPSQGDAAGVYFLFLSDECVYVGQSVNVHRRVQEHLVQGVKEFDSYAWTPVQKENLVLAEAAYIAKLQPRLNVFSAASGPRLVRGYDVDAFVQLKLTEDRQERLATSLSHDGRGA